MAENARELREDARIRRAVAAVEAPGPASLDAALARIGAAFDEAASICHFKIRVERWLRHGPRHPAVRARFSARAEMLRGRDLGSAVLTVERWWRHESKAFQIASALGRGNRLSVEVLRELRLILRWMRFRQMEGEYEAAISALRAAEIVLAAAE